MLDGFVHLSSSVVGRWGGKSACVRDCECSGRLKCVGIRVSNTLQHGQNKRTSSLLVLIHVVWCALRDCSKAQLAAAFPIS